MKILLPLILTSIAYSQTPQQLFLQSPPPPAINTGNTTIVGNLGNSTYYYWVIANYPQGVVLPTGSIKVVQAPTTLNSSNYVKVTWNGLANVTYYSVLKTLTPAIPVGVCTCLVVDNLTNSTYNDQSSSLGIYVVPTGIAGANGTIGIDMSTYYLPKSQFKIPVGDNIPSNFITLGINNVQGGGPVTNIKVGGTRGTSYAVGDTGTINDFCGTLNYIVDAIGVGGTVTSLHLTNTAPNVPTTCSNNSNAATTVSTGSGSGTLRVQVYAPELLLPSASSCKRCITEVTDATGPSDCTTGGSFGNVSVCYSDGVIWRPVGGGGTSPTCGTIVVCNNQANTYSPGSRLQDFGNDPILSKGQTTIGPDTTAPYNGPWALVNGVPNGDPIGVTTPLEIQAGAPFVPSDNTLRSTEILNTTYNPGLDFNASYGYGGLSSLTRWISNKDFIILAVPADYRYPPRTALEAGEFAVKQSGSGTIGAMTSVFANPYIDGTGTVTLMKGVDCYQDIVNTGHVVTGGCFWAGGNNNWGGTFDNAFAFRSDDMNGMATLSYYDWWDSQGVRATKEDNSFNAVGQAITSLYNPQVTKYVPGTADFEAAVVARWNTNVVEIGAVSGGTGTLRPTSIIGASVQAIGGSANTVVCWGADGKTLGFATVAEITAGTCHTP